LTALLLDTHAWIWFAAGDARLSKHARVLSRALDEEALLLSAISVYEAALIGRETEEGKRRGRQALRMRPSVEQWLRDALVGTRVVQVPIDAEIAAAAALSALHADPFDRLIVASALRAKARLVTADEKIVSFARACGLQLLEL
jgi:PIN domain nuclease of toxin-antitoxin system